MKKTIMIFLLIVGCREYVEDNHNHPIDIKNSHGLWCIEGFENGENIEYHFWMAFDNNENRLAIFNLLNSDCYFKFRNQFYSFYPKYEYNVG